MARYYGFQNETKDYLNRLQRETSVLVTPAAAKSLNDRVESLKKSGIWSQYSLGFNDVDGDAYLTRASVADLIGRAEVLWFVRGMKALGLYSNMVAWPLRSYQNIGTGSTVYSLGGLGIYNGTLVSSPPWSSSGVFFTDDTAQYMTTTLTISTSAEYTWFSAIQCNAAGSQFNVIASTRNGSTGGFTFAQSWGGLTQLAVWKSGTWNGPTTTQITDGLYHTVASYVRTNTTPKVARVVIDTNSAVSSTDSSSSQIANYPLWIGSETAQGNTSRSLGGNMPFFAHIQNLSNENIFRSLYKATLGNGLNLN